jgi:ActR/RegA family two-component response regulator
LGPERERGSASPLAIYSPQLATASLKGPAVPDHAREALIVDDDQSFLLGLMEVVEREGYRTWGASTVRAALASLRRHPNVSVVLADLNLPDGSGIDIIQRTRATRPDVSIILITSQASVETAVDSLRLGASDYLTKPVDFARVKMVLHGSNRLAAAQKAVAQGAGRVFLSYAREDRTTVSRLYQRLKRAGFAPWMDRYDLGAGQPWKASIRNAIKRSAFFLACLSKHSVNKRGVVQQELREGMEVARTVPASSVYMIPVRLDECEVPDDLSEYQWVDLFEAGGWEKLYQAVYSGLSFKAGQTSRE